MNTPDDVDGRYAQGWGGSAPNGVHVNVLLARRGSATAAAIATAFTAPSRGFTPILACLGASQAEYETLNPPTIIVNKSATETEMSETLVFGGAQVGIAQGVLDTVADGLLAADQETLVFVSLWVDAAAADETAVKAAARTAARTALREAVLGRDEAELAQLVANRDAVTHPFYSGE